jgi:hypothetical protein
MTAAARRARGMRTIKVDDVQVGHRYVKTIHPDYNDGWTVASVERHRCPLKTLTEVRPGVYRWAAIDLVTVTYRNGQSVTFRAGEEVAIDCGVTEERSR